MKEISKEDIFESLDYNALVSQLRNAFANPNYNIPKRQHLDLPTPNSALIMPGWNDRYYGLKQIIVSPNNSQYNLPTIQGKYDLFDVINGQHLVAIDAQALTSVRTAASSVLASSFFVDQPETLLVMGNGVIGKQLVKAYNAFYTLNRTQIWSRSLDGNIDLPKEANNADIISCATHAYEPIIQGEWVNEHKHFDLVGSYRKDMREANDDLISKCEIYVDDWNALQESGDLYTPIANEIITKENIKGTLFDLCRGELIPRKDHGLTLFKSVGHALEDLAAAIYFYELYF